MTFQNEKKNEKRFFFKISKMKLNQRTYNSYLQQWSYKFKKFPSFSLGSSYSYKSRHSYYVLMFVLLLFVRLCAKSKVCQAKVDKQLKINHCFDYQF